ncbi:MAG: hypothetical protein ACJ8FO_05930 [Sphingomicrobium sp.]
MKILIGVSALSAALLAAEPAAHPVGLPQQAYLTREQALQRADERFEQFDLNRDGVVTRQEAQRLGPKLLLQRAMTGRDVAPGIGGHTLRFLKRRFAGVEAVTRQQFEAAFLAHFDLMDINRDGVLTAEEREEAH